MCSIQARARGQPAPNSFLELQFSQMDVPLVWANSLRVETLFRKSADSDFPRSRAQNKTRHVFCTRFYSTLARDTRPHAIARLTTPRGTRVHAKEFTLHTTQLSVAFRDWTLGTKAVAGIRKLARAAVVALPNPSCNRKSEGSVPGTAPSRSACFKGSGFAPPGGSRTREGTPSSRVRITRRRTRVDVAL
jgi:hypothetical protein